jgi:hypothetical protein
LKRLCSLHKDDIINTRVFPLILKCWKCIHHKSLMDEESWNVIKELLTRQIDPIDIIRMLSSSSDINQFIIRCSQLWLKSHKEAALSFLQSISPSVILVIMMLLLSIYHYHSLGNESSRDWSEKDGT